PVQCAGEHPPAALLRAHPDRHGPLHQLHGNPDDTAPRSVPDLGQARMSHQVRSARLKRPVAGSDPLVPPEVPHPRRRRLGQPPGWGRDHRGRRPPWDGTYAGLLYEVPEAHRAFRDRLRRAAQLAGYGILRPGLLIAPTDRSAELAGVWDNPPPGAHVLRASLGLSTGDASRVAAEVWGLDALAGRYRSAVATARAAVDQAAREPHAGRQALVTLAGILQPVYDVAADDPDLPRELLPPGWPGDQIGLAVGSALRTLGPAVAAYVEGLGAPYRTSSEGTIRREKGQPVVKHSSPATSASTS
ncbi:MAG: PaaX family transcriptional regulator C-terminal domain-containing protein, partial [Acidimicrobiales bacterium]